MNSGRAKEKLLIIRKYDTIDLSTIDFKYGNGKQSVNASKPISRMSSNAGAKAQENMEPLINGVVKSPKKRKNQSTISSIFLLG
ncbi:hypothetical protein AC578_7035 [Pseudocercospora eumusae]|uniref:Uncharacterized protein n=1 Tax=Pseudocercospora eumusae TaxID=321146 RepID=A0A139HCK4_9PEZI|nr:hypothetical protein AC578_7035 [Pseudocercospora eumusae]